MRLIDADDFGSRMYHEVFEKDSEDQKWDSGCWMRYKLFERVLREQPEVKPQRMRGRWVPEFNGRFTGGAYWFSCSKCKRIVPDVKNGGWNYCPQCGADMRGEEDVEVR